MGGLNLVKEGGLNKKANPASSLKPKILLYKVSVRDLSKKKKACLDVHARRRKRILRDLPNNILDCRLFGNVKPAELHF